MNYARGLACCCAGVFAFCCPANAEPKAKSPVLVELFTSQNCSSCPSANEKLIELSETDDIFPLTYSVAYWNYLGGHDPFARPEFGKRQRAYADAFDLRSVYTPQTVVDGCVQTSGNKSLKEVSSKIKYAQQPHGYEINLRVASGGVDLSTPEKIPEAEVWLAGYHPGITTIVPSRGDNKNKMISHVNMVTSLKSLGDWDGSETRFEVTCKDEACVVIVQEKASKDIMSFVEFSAPVPERAALIQP